MADCWWTIDGRCGSASSERERYQQQPAVRFNEPAADEFRHFGLAGRSRATAAAASGHPHSGVDAPAAPAAAEWWTNSPLRRRAEPARSGTPGSAGKPRAGVPLEPLICSTTAKRRRYVLLPTLRRTCRQANRSRKRDIHLAPGADLSNKHPTLSTSLALLQVEVRTQSCPFPSRTCSPSF